MTENEDIKYHDVCRLKLYLGTLSYKERVAFVTMVVLKVGVRRSTFFNWKSMACRIPDEAKVAMDEISGRNIFD